MDTSNGDAAGDFKNKLVNSDMICKKPFRVVRDANATLRRTINVKYVARYEMLVLDCVVLQGVACV